MSRLASMDQPNCCGTCRFSVDGGKVELGGIGPGNVPIYTHYLLCKQGPPGTLEMHPRDWCFRWERRTT